MADISIRNLDDSVRERLRVLAAQHGRSMEAEIRAILEQAVRAQRGESLVDRLVAAAVSAGGADLDLPPRADAPRSANLS
ncbi:MAG: Arc family DNA-binding protein [Acidimicrobiia bacterium]|nr:Arc family DNA-binding protein [Acidimicrobiia bacterium]